MRYLSSWQRLLEKTGSKQQGPISLLTFYTDCDLTLQTLQWKAGQRQEERGNNSNSLSQNQYVFYDLKIDFKNTPLSLVSLTL